MARFHNHADQWVPPAVFVRIRWGWHAFFGDSLERGGINSGQCWDLTPDDLQGKFHQVASLVKGLMTQLGDGRVDCADIRFRCRWEGGQSVVCHRGLGPPRCQRTRRRDRRQDDPLKPVTTQESLVHLIG